MKTTDLSKILEAAMEPDSSAVKQASERLKRHAIKLGVDEEKIDAEVKRITAPRTNGNGHT